VNCEKASQCRATDARSAEDKLRHPVANQRHAAGLFTGENFSIINATRKWALPQKREWQSILVSQI
jgi:hypothetical protein